MKALEQTGPAGQPQPPAERPVVAPPRLCVSRFEYKYQLPPECVPEVCRFLLKYCAPDSHAEHGEWYPVRSLYLDTSQYLFYRQYADKVLRRRKLRVRTYGAAGSPVKLEVKDRHGDAISKESLVLDWRAWAEWLSAGGGEPRLAGQAFDCRFLHLIESLRADPKFLIEYERLAFTSDVDEAVRVTLDRRIRYQPCREWDLTGDACGWRHMDDALHGRAGKSAYVLELKFQSRPPAWLRDFALAFGLGRRGFSKYGRAVKHAAGRYDAPWDLRPLDAAPGRIWRIL
jgi:hypothetical protein